MLKVLSGYGVHSGMPSQVYFKYNPLGNFCSITFNTLSVKSLDYTLGNYLYQSNYATSLKFNNSILHTPEHLMASLIGFAKQPLEIVLEGVEVPILEGSADSFYKSIQCFIKDPPQFLEYFSNLTKEYVTEYGILKVKPHSCFEVHSTFQKGEVKQTYQWNTSDDDSILWFEEDLITAKTFINWNNWKQQTANGLLKGVNSNSGNLIAWTYQEFQEAEKAGMIGSFPYLFLENNVVKTIKSNECAKHKILDLIGDLALVSLMLPKLKIEAFNTGHYHNHLLIRDLIKERRQYEQCK